MGLGFESLRGHHVKISDKPLKKGFIAIFFVQEKEIFLSEKGEKAYIVVGGETFMSRELSISECRQIFAGAVTWVTILCIAGGAAAIYKILFSGRGSINIGPFRATWGK